MKTAVIALSLLLLVMLYGCAQASVKDINDNPQDYLGKKVIVSGKAIAPIEFGTMSGFTLKADGSTIMISSDTVPKANDEVTVKGTVVKGFFMQQYIFADKITITASAEK